MGPKIMCLHAACSLLRSLRIEGNNQIRDDGIEMLCKEIHNNSTLNDFHMYSWGISVKSMNFTCVYTHIGLKRDLLWNCEF